MKIGFKNFKKFADFPPIELSPITFIVGPNNSGKSSFIKGVLLLIYNLIENQAKRNKSTKLDFNDPFIKNISFFNDTTTDYGWGDFVSSLNFHSSDINITFTLIIENYKVEIECGKYSRSEIAYFMDSEDVPISKIKISSLQENEGIEFEFHRSVEINQIGEWNKYYKVSKDSLLEWIEETIQQIKKAQNEESDLNRKYSTSDVFVIRLFQKLVCDFGDDSFFLNYIEYKTLSSGLRSLSEKIIDTFDKGDSIDLSICTDEEKEIILHNGLNYFFLTKLESFNDTLYKDIYSRLVYIETHNASHKIAWNSKEKNDFVAQTIFEYKNRPNTVASRKSREFITKWLKKFGIGEDFSIKKHFHGEIYTVDIIHDKNTYNLEQMVSGSSVSTLKGISHGSFTPLGNMGTGSIQIFAMLLKIAIAIDKSKEEELQLIVMEEPEQNSHPSFQSQLAEMFYDAYEASGKKINFLIETHSEYLIRRTQVMVAKENYPSEEDLQKNNPFRVYYFPEEGLSYDMKFLLSGRFENNFGKGFFDEAALAALTISKLERRKNNG